MREQGTWLVPTLIAPTGVLRAAESGARIPDWAIEKAKGVIDVHRSSIRAAIAAGVKVAFGTDCPVSPHGTNLDEFVEMRALGMSAPDVIRSATAVAADLLGRDDVGIIERGRRADLVIVEGDGFDFDGLRDRITAVYKDGVEAGGPRFHGRLTV
jgi:imidazolonepropionase-like amidohydrolase